MLIPINGVLDETLPHFSICQMHSVSNFLNPEADVTEFHVSKSSVPIPFVDIQGAKSRATVSRTPLQVIQPRLL